MDTAISIKIKVKEFLTSLKLELSEEKTLITQARGGVAHFLGTEIRKTPTTKSILVRRNNRLLRQRITSGNIKMTMDTDKVLKKLEKTGLFNMKDGR